MTDHGPDLPSLAGLDELLDAERRRPGPGAQVQERVHAHLAVTLGFLPPLPPQIDASAVVGPAGAAGPAGGALVAGGKLGAAALASKVGAAAVAAIVVAGGITAATLWPRPPPPPVVAAPIDAPVLATAPPPVVVAPPVVAPPVFAEPPPAPVVAAPVRRRVVAPVVAPVEEAPPPEERALHLAEERTLLDDARRRISRGEGGAALAALDDHRARFPTGQLVEERDALAVLALVKAGRKDEAQERARAFVAAHPGSLFVQAVTSAAGL